MRNKRVLSTEQREKRLIELIRDGKELGFNVALIQGYEEQLITIQEELKSIKEQITLINLKGGRN